MRKETGREGATDRLVVISGRDERDVKAIEVTDELAANHDGACQGAMIDAKAIAPIGTLVGSLKPLVNWLFSSV